VKVPPLALVVSSPRAEPEEKRPRSVSMSVAVNSPGPPMLKAAVVPDGTVSLAALVESMVPCRRRTLSKRASVPLLTSVGPV